MPAETKPAIDPNLKKKQVLVVMLLAGLLIAIVTQPGGDDESADNVEISLASHPAPTVSPAKPAPSGDSAPKPEANLRESWHNRLAETRELCRLSLDEIEKLQLLAPEPVRARESAPPPMPPVQAIYGTSNGRAALLGDSIVRSGQQLPEGGKVLHVTTDGIQVAR